MFSLLELQLIRQSLDVITISGKDAKIVANLQIKTEQAIEAEKIKGEELQQVLKSKSK
jgi:hypothetical protein